MAGYLDDNGNYYEGDRRVWTDKDVKEIPQEVIDAMAAVEKSDLEAKQDIQSIPDIKKQFAMMATCIDDLSGVTTIAGVKAVLQKAFTISDVLKPTDTVKS